MLLEHVIGWYDVLRSRTNVNFPEEQQRLYAHFDQLVRNHGDMIRIFGPCFVRPSLLYKPYHRFWSANGIYNEIECYTKGLATVLVAYSVEQFRIHPSRTCSITRLMALQREELESDSPVNKYAQSATEPVFLPTIRSAYAESPGGVPLFNPLELRVQSHTFTFDKAAGRTFVKYKGRAYAPKFFVVKYSRKPEAQRLRKAWCTELSILRTRLQLPLLRYLRMQTQQDEPLLRMTKVQDRQLKWNPFILDLKESKRLEK